MSTNEVWLVGAGEMSKAYAKVLNALKVNYKVIGRGHVSALSFEQSFGVEVEQGGLQSYICKEKTKKPSHAIVATNVEELYSSVVALLKHGVKNILVEKPGALEQQEFEDLSIWANKQDANVVIAYNRRCYASVIKAQEIIQQDGGVESFSFEFTEWAHKIAPLKKSVRVKEKWFLANSTHVVDLAFYLGGFPKEISTYTAGGLDWHPTSSVFSGAGISEMGALFSYKANWNSAGRWGVVVETPKHRIILSPLEKLQLQKKGSIETTDVDIDDVLDKIYKPGLYLQTKRFLLDQLSTFPLVDEQSRMSKIYFKISGE